MFSFGYVSLYFLAFLAISIIGYWLTPNKYRWIVLLISSIVFYVLLSWKSIFFVLFTTLVMYFSARYIDKKNRERKEYFLTTPNLSLDEKKEYKIKIKKKQKLILSLAIISVVLVLAVMKYLEFAITNINWIWSHFSEDPLLRMPVWFLPLGISFYTFQAISYLVDVYWGKIESENNFLKFSLYMIYFPKILQGPIIRYGEMKDAFFGEHKFIYEDFVDGLVRTAWGYFKKLVIADCFIVFIRYAFDNPTSISAFESVVVIFLYLIQDYCDFSGYMDISIGVSSCYGVKLPENFNHPYFARSIDEYWRRWHMTLGQWFKDYVFYPLSTSRFSLWLGKKSKKAFKNFGKKIPAIFGLLVVWFLTGLWHGASWTFVIWGLFYGSIIILDIIFEPFWKKVFSIFHIQDNAWYVRVVQHCFTLLVLLVGRVIFISNSLGDAFVIMSKWPHFLTDRGIGTIRETIGGGLPFFIALGAAGVVFVVDLIQELKPSSTFIQKLRNRPMIIRVLLYTCLVVAIIWFGCWGYGVATYEFGYVNF